MEARRTENLKTEPTAESQHLERGPTPRAANSNSPSGLQEREWWAFPFASIPTQNAGASLGSWVPRLLLSPARTFIPNERYYDARFTLRFKTLSCNSVRLYYTDYRIRSDYRIRFIKFLPVFAFV